MQGLWFVSLTLAVCAALAAKEACGDPEGCSSVSLLQRRQESLNPDTAINLQNGEALSLMQLVVSTADRKRAGRVDEEQPVAVNTPWWISAGVQQEGEEKDMGGFNTKTFSAEQQEHFGVDEMGMIQDMGKFNAAMDEMGKPELKNWQADDGMAAPGFLQIARQPVGNPMVNPPWWVSAGIEEEGPERDMGGFTMKTMSEAQQERFGVNDVGEIQDMDKFNAAMDDIGKPELKNWTATDSMTAPSLLQARRQPVANPMVNRPWWISAGIEEEGPERDMGGFTMKTMSAEQQARFGVNDVGEIQDMEKFNAEMEALGHPELKNWSASEGEVSL